MRFFRRLVYFLIFLFIGLGICFYLNFKSNVAVKIRPILARLNFFEALVSKHFWEWLWYTGRPVMWVMTLIFFGIVGLIVGSLVESKNKRENLWS